LAAATRKRLRYAYDDISLLWMLLWTAAVVVVVIVDEPFADRVAWLLAAVVLAAGPKWNVFGNVYDR
jgi:hypothetical protein